LDQSALYPQEQIDKSLRQPMHDGGSYNAPGLLAQVAEEKPPKEGPQTPPLLRIEGTGIQVKPVQDMRQAKQERGDHDPPAPIHTQEAPGGVKSLVQP
jgi:hypothetical protein